ncbi:MAG TPA: WecB/TagA/CpsF family glycosyltransferase [Candidatus Scatomorpha pullicola]|nr:WecB/TagA/CpsF family glycosyltransferase [Candidatus Scatomorpha pullicola]
MSRIDVLGVSFDDLTMDEAVEIALGFMQERRACYACTPNPEIVMAAKGDAALRAALSGAELVLADGVGITKAAAMLGTPLKSRVPGIDFASNVISRLAERGGSVYLLGAKPLVAEAAADKLTQTYPGIVIAGTNDGYFTDEAPVIEKINAASPDFLMVCLGSPKQELWMSANAGRLSCGLMAGLGGSLDVLAGNVQRAPETWRRLGLEWLYRVIKEPKRLGRVMKLPAFVLEAAAEGRRRRHG